MIELEVQDANMQSNYSDLKRVYLKNFFMK